MNILYLKCMAVHVLGHFIYIVCFRLTVSREARGLPLVPDHHQSARALPYRPSRMDSDDEFDDALLGIGVSEDKRCASF